MANITYYKLNSKYDGDVTKYCGLEGTEIDSNFYFLRGNDIKYGYWLQDTGETALVLVKENNDKIVIGGLDTKSTFENLNYDKETGTLYFTIDGKEYSTDGFFVDTDLTNRIDFLSDEINKLKCTVSGVVSETIDEFLKTTDKLKNDIKNIVALVSSNTSSIEEIEAEIENLKKDTNKIDGIISDLTSLSDEVEKNTIANNNLKNLIVNLDNEITVLRSNLVQTQNIVDSFSSTIRQIKRNIGSATKAELENAVTEINDSIDTLANSTQDCIDTLTSELETTNNHITSIENSVTNLYNIISEKGINDITDENIIVAGGVVDAKGIWENDVIPSGTPLEYILKRLLCNEIYPSSPTLPKIYLNGTDYSNVAEVGTTITIDSVTLTKTNGSFNASYTKPQQPSIENSFNDDVNMSYNVYGFTNYTPSKVSSGINGATAKVSLGTNKVSYLATVSYNAPSVKPLTNLGNETTKTGETANENTAIWTNGTATATGETIVVGVYPIYYGTIGNSENPTEKILSDSDSFTDLKFSNETEDTRIAIAYPENMTISYIGVYNSITKQYNSEIIEKYGEIIDSTIVINGTNYKLWKRSGKNYITNPIVKIIFDKKTSEK